MATINNVIDFDTAFLVASEFGVNAVKKIYYLTIQKIQKMN